MLERGETMVASGGLGAAVVLLGAMGASAWWTIGAQHDAQARARREQFNTVGVMLGKAVEGMLASGDVDALRRVLSGAAKTYGLERCNIKLPTGTVVVDACAPGGDTTSGGLPPNWSTSQAPAETGEMTVSEQEGGGLKLTSPLWVARRGPVTLELADDDVAGAGQADQWRTQAGLGAIGAAGFLGLLLTYRRMRKRLGALGAIGEALSAVQAGESSAEALKISAELGPAASAWNKLLSEREKLKERAIAERAGEELSSTRRGRDSEVASACDALWQGVVLVDEQMRVRYANGAAGVFLQAKREDMLPGPGGNGKPGGPKELGAFLRDAQALEAIKGVVAGKSKQRVVVEIERNAEQGGGTLRFSVRPLRKEDHGRALVVIEDVTQQRVADVARNSFVAQATHELRTPLTNIRLYIDSLIEDGAEDPLKRSTALNVISQESRRLERIVGDMLSVAEIEAGQLKLQEGDVRLDALFQEAKADFAEQARKKEITLRFDLAPKLPVIRADRDKVVLAIHNLVGNAIKYTPAGGEVVVKAFEAGGELAVEVKDNGIGIKPEEQEKIFEKFYRAKDKRISGITGTGLGLALAREVARLHGGDISLDSQVDRGSTFTLHLPVRSPNLAAAA
jgi:signal transduction histidine kinase